MRALMFLTPASSHVVASAPLAWALQTAGHAVLVASQPEAAEMIKAAGLVAAPLKAGLDLMETTAEPAAITEQMMSSLDLNDAEDVIRITVREFVLPSLAGYTSLEAVPLVEACLELIDGWRPDVIVWDGGYYPAGIAAHMSKTPHVRLLWGRDWEGMLRHRLRELGPGTTDVLAEHMAPLLKHLGIDFDERILLGEASIDPNPVEMRWQTGLDYLSVRWTPYTGPGVVPDWATTPAPNGRICVSLGLSYRELADDSDVPIVEILRGLAELGPEVVATLDARQVAPGTILPGNVRLVDHLPLSALLSTCSAVVNHGGTGTWSAALSHGVPQVIITRPHMDYPSFGEHTEAAGAGVHLPLIEDRQAMADAVVRAVARVLSDPAYAESARALFARTNRAPSPAELVAKIEEMV
jgi:hypothetical protein